MTTSIAHAPTSSPTLDDVLDNADITLRFELGSRTLRASDVARLTRGDIIDLGVGVGEPVAITVGDALVGEGELVELEGNVGVRILHLARGRHGDTPHTEA